MTATLGVELLATCRMASGDASKRRLSSRGLVSVSSAVSCGCSTLFLDDSKYHVGVGTIGVATFGVGLPASCPTAPRGSSSLYSVFCRRQDKQASRRSASVSHRRVLWRPEARR
jgi:hypothetical protein